jgi:hypothetical protein
MIDSIMNEVFHPDLLCRFDIPQSQFGEYIVLEEPYLRRSGEED